MPGRTFSSPSYRFGFNGKEKDDEIHGSSGTSYDYGFRIYDPRLGRFLSVDPLTRSYPYYTPYQFAGNKPIFAIDLDGLEEKPAILPNNVGLPERRTSEYLGTPNLDFGPVRIPMTQEEAQQGRTNTLGGARLFYNPGYHDAQLLVPGFYFFQKPVLKTTNTTQVNTNTTPDNPQNTSNANVINGGFQRGSPILLPGGVGQINVIAQQALQNTVSTAPVALDNPITDAPTVSPSTNSQGLPQVSTTTNTTQPIQVSTLNTTITVTLSTDRTQISAGQLIRQRFNAIRAQLIGQGVSPANIIQGPPQFNVAGLPNGNQTNFTSTTTTTTSTGTQTTTTTTTNEYTYGEEK